MARAKKRADGRYTCSLDVGRDGKKRQRIVFYGRTVDEARAARDEYVRTRMRKLEQEDGLTLGQWAERWIGLYNSGIARRTMARKQAALRQIVAVLGSKELSDITHADIQAYMNTREGKSRADISLHKGILSGLFETAMLNKLVKENPCAGIRSPKAGQYHGHRALDEWEQSVIIAAAPHHRAGLWALLMMCCGLRREEMAALHWEDVDLEAGTITVARAAEMDAKGTTKSTKTEAGTRTLPVPPPVRIALEGVPARARKGLVCTNASGGALTLTSYRQAWESFLLVCLRAANGIRPYGTVQGWRSGRDSRVTRAFTCTAHDLRYTYATVLYDADVDVKTAQYLMGHKDFSVTMRIYTQLSEKKKVASIARLSERFSEIW